MFVTVCLHFIGSPFFFKITKIIKKKITVYGNIQKTIVLAVWVFDVLSWVAIVLSFSIITNLARVLLKG